MKYKVINSDQELASTYDTYAEALEKVLDLGDRSILARIVEAA